MNNSPPGLGSHYASISTLQIPQHWSDKQALAVSELLDSSRDSINARVCNSQQRTTGFRKSLHCCEKNSASS